MANQLFPNGRQRFLGGDTAWDSSTIRACLVRNYTYLSTHTTLSQVEAAGDVVQSQTLASKTITDGVADAADVTFTTISGTVIAAVILYHEVTAADADRWLLAYIDTATGLPVTPNGGNITITWDNGANKIFKL